MSNEKIKIRESLTLSPFFLFFLIHSSQTGIGMLSMQRDIAKYAEQDAWIGIVIAGLYLHVIFLMLFKILASSNNGDVISLHQQYFGKIFGNILSMVFVVYFFLLLLLVFRSYIEILQIWVYSIVAPWEIGLVITVVIFYIVLGEFRVIAGISLWSTLIPIILVFVLGYTLKFSHFSNLQPFFNHDIKEILLSSKEGIISFVGFETVLLFFPFIKKGKSTKRWAHLGLLFTTLTYLILTIITYAFYNQGMLKYIIWPTLSMTKIVQVPFIERFEYIFIFSWLLVVMPPMCLCIWAITRSLKEMLNIKSSFSLTGILVLVNILSILLIDRDSIHFVKKATTQLSIYILFH